LNSALQLLLNIKDYFALQTPRNIDPIYNATIVFVSFENSSNRPAQALWYFQPRVALPLENLLCLLPTHLANVLDEET
jgi:hypothetical protein